MIKRQTPLGCRSSAIILWSLEKLDQVVAAAQLPLDDDEGRTERKEDRCSRADARVVSVSRSKSWMERQRRERDRARLAYLTADRIVLYKNRCDDATRW